MLYFNLGPIFKARNVQNPQAFLVKSGFSAFNANRFVMGKITSFRLEYIELLCRALFCEPSDLLSFRPDKDEVMRENHPLLNLKNNPETNYYQDIIAQMPYREIKALNEVIVAHNK